MAIYKELVIEKGGKYWGIVYEDGYRREYGWVDSIDEALTWRQTNCNENKEPGIQILKSYFVDPRVISQVKNAKVRKITVSDEITRQFVDE